MCVIGWVDIRTATVARVQVNLLYSLKDRENDTKFVWPSNRFIVGLGHTVQYTIFNGPKFFSHNVDFMGIKRRRNLRRF
jgi:hypothetical protein